MLNLEKSILFACVESLSNNHCVMEIMQVRVLARELLLQQNLELCRFAGVNTVQKKQENVTVHTPLCNVLLNNFID
tara:strand:+ start:452 stop:679 length:228 start_codon:yes stop_codon:yes gene_type:complete